MKGTNAKKNQTHHIQNRAQNTNLNKKQKTFKTVRGALTYQTIMQNTLKTVPNTLT